MKNENEKQRQEHEQRKRAQPTPVGQCIAEQVWTDDDRAAAEVHDVFLRSIQPRWIVEQAEAEDQARAASGEKT